MAAITTDTTALLRDIYEPDDADAYNIGPSSGAATPVLGKLC
jgi:hypothetical protein